MSSPKDAVSPPVLSDIHWRMPQSRREYEKARKTLGAAVSAELKRMAPAKGWRFAWGWLFQERDGWFLDVRGGPWVRQDCTTVEFRAKPMALDPLFWEIVKTPENVTEALSFRLFGAWTCQGPAWSEARFQKTVRPKTSPFGCWTGPTFRLPIHPYLLTCVRSPSSSKIRRNSRGIGVLGLRSLLRCSRLRGVLMRPVPRAWRRSAGGRVAVTPSAQNPGLN